MADDKQPRAANIFDVARLAGVSHQTVSRVINGMTNVRPATRERVESAIAQLRYSPSPAARALVTRRTRTLGFVNPAVSSHGPTSIAMHFTMAAHSARYSVDTISTAPGDPGAVRAAVEALLRQRVDAIVVLVAESSVLDLVSGLDLGIPLVVAGAAEQRSPHLVSIDQFRGARSAVQHLVDLGHQHILHIAGPATAPDATERVRGWRRELATHRLEVVDPSFGDWSAASGYRIGSSLEIPPDSAIFVGNDQMAIGVLSALRERGLRVPDDVSIVGFDDIPEAGFLYPPLTTVRQDFDALGRMMLQKVLVALEEQGEMASDTPLPTELVVRRSTRALDSD